jgi:uncharacterized protein with HEPN domain
MAEHLALIEEHRPANVEELTGDILRSSAILRWLEIIGEAAANVSESIRAAHPEVPWRDIVAMRNRLIHAYPDVNMSLVWGVVDRDGPALRRAIEEILEGGA